MKKFIWVDVCTVVFAIILFFAWAFIASATNATTNLTVQ